MAKRRSAREYASDKVAKVLGSWTFVLFQLGLCCVWIILNTIPHVTHWDDFPFSILANLLQIEGALAASFILIASNRQGELDSKRIDENLVVSEHMKAEMDSVVEDMKHIRNEMQ